MNNARNRTIAGAALALFLAPLALDLGLSGSAAPFRYFAADAFYYHTVARNLVHLGYATFDQLHPTNGFHPLWQVTLGALYGAVEGVGASELAYLYASVLLGAVAIAGCIALLASALTLDGEALPRAFALLPVGAYGVVALPAWLLAYGYVNEHEGPLPLYGTLWSYANGMESAFALLFFAALLRLAANARWRSLGFGLAFGACALLTTLSRLDHALLVAPFAGYALLRARRVRDRDATRSALLACGVLVAGLAIYLLINRAYAGTFMPISGSGKTTFPRPHLAGVRWFFSELWRSPLTPGWLDSFCRQAQLIVPALAALAWLRKRLRAIWTDAGIDLAITLSALGVLLVCGYDFCFVPMGAIGPWYTPVPVLFVSIAALRVLARRERETQGMGLVAAFALAVLLVFAGFQRREGYHREFAELYLHDAARLREHYAPERPRLVERDDGIVAFATGLPCMSGFGFTDDVAVARARRSGDWLALARARGFRRWVTLAYAPVCSGEGCNEAAVQRAEATFGLSGSRFAVEYRSRHTRLVVVSLDE